MRYLILVFFFLASNVSAITACLEHGYCPDHGTLQIYAHPDVPDNLRPHCLDASFKVEFSIKGGKPIDISVVSGPEKLRVSVAQSFKKWQFGAVKPVENTSYTVNLNSECEVVVNREISGGA